jgi:hypothetical protein
MFAYELSKMYPDEHGWIRLFISDLRKKQQEDCIAEDMDLQQQVHFKLRPYKSYLKFRLPYADQTEKKSRLYLEGDLYFLIWGNQRTSETRLLVHKNANSREYIFSDYEDTLYHFNMNERTFCYKHEITCDGIDHCYDCRAEIYVLEKYIKMHETLKFFSQIANKNQFCPENIQDFVNYINHAIKAHLNDINYSLKLDNCLVQGKYAFTSFQHGLRILSKSGLINYLKHPSEISLNENLTDQFSNLNLN